MLSTSVQELRGGHRGGNSVTKEDAESEGRRLRPNREGQERGRPVSARLWLFLCGKGRFLSRLDTV